MQTLQHKVFSIEYIIQGSFRSIIVYFNTLLELIEHILFEVKKT